MKKHLRWRLVIVLTLGTTQRKTVMNDDMPESPQKASTGIWIFNAGSGLKSRSQICVGGVSHLNLANWTLDKKYQRGACLSTWQ